MNNNNKKTMISPSDLQKEGNTKYEFYKFVNERQYERIGFGLYLPQDEWIDELAILHHRCPKAIFSHDEAFYYHGLTDREPLVHTMTIYSGYNPHRLKNSNCKLYTVKKELLDVGKTFGDDNYGNTIPVYDLERTICDLFRSRNSIEIQEFNSVLKAYINRKDKDFNKLIEYGKLFHIEKIIQKYMEVLL